MTNSILVLPSRSSEFASPLTPGVLRNIRTLAAREAREAIRSRWFVLYTVAFAALGLSVSAISSASTGGMSLSSYGRTAAGLINLVLLVVPLMALSAGAGCITSDRERGVLASLLAQPIARTELLLGKYLGFAAALLASLCLGLGACAAVLAIQGASTSPAGMLWLGSLSFLLALAMLSVGVLVSVLARKTSVAIGTAIFLWLALVFVTDLGLMAGTLALKLRIEDLFAISCINPLQVFKMWALHAVNGELDVLGPAGLYASDEFGSRLPWLFGGCMLAWIVAPLVAAGVLFSRRSPL